MKPFILLASQSPRRSMLLTREGYEFEVMPSHADEHDASHHDVHDIVMENARIKGREVVNRLKDQGRVFPSETVLVAADTLVVMGEKVFGKPKDMAQAESFIRELGGKQHEVLTGVYLYRFSNGQEKKFLDATQVVLKVMTREEIAALFARVNPLDKAAAYGFQDAPEIVSKLEGSGSNVMGLPMEALERELNQFLA